MWCAAFPTCIEYDNLIESPLPCSLSRPRICSNTARDAFTVGYGGVGPLLTTAEEQQVREVLR